MAASRAVPARAHGAVRSRYLRSSFSQSRRPPHRAGGVADTRSRPDRAGRRCGSRPKLRAHVGRPALGIKTVRLDERQRHALHAETEAGSMRDGFIGIANPEFGGEVILMPIERANRRGLVQRNDRNQDFKLQPLVQLICRQHFAGPPEKWISRKIALRWQAQSLQQVQPTLQPRVAPGHDIIGWSHANEFAHAKRLQPRGFIRRLMAIHPPQQRQQASPRGQQATEARVNRITGRRREHDFSNVEKVFPALAVVDPGRQLPCLGLISEEAVHRPRQLREPGHVGDFVQQGTRQDRWKQHFLGAIGFGYPAYQIVEAPQDIFEDGTSTVPPLDPRGNDQTMLYQAGVKGINVVDHRHGASLKTSNMDALFAAIRSFEIISDADNESRYWRPRLNGLSFLYPRMPTICSAR